MSVRVGPVWGADPNSVDAEDRGDVLAEYGESIRLNPSLAYVRRQFGNALMFKGDIERAIPEYREAARLDPTDVSVHREAAHRDYLRKRFDLAIAEMQEAIPRRARVGAGLPGPGDRIS